ncbi:MAG: VOC family protein, partial [Acidimicrobiales bacterium]
AAAFWAAALGYRRKYARPPYVVLEPPGDTAGLPAVVIQQVPEPAASSRAHLDLRVPDPDATVRRLEALGASVVGRVDEGWTSWTVMADPWGTPLCVCPAR